MPPNLSRIVSTIKSKAAPAPPRPTVDDLLRGRAADQRSDEEEQAAAEGARALLHAVRPAPPQSRADTYAQVVQFKRQQGWS